ncbi:MAG: 50S ribosomal protein L2 [Candidatus Omnitrophica bacterium]|nr:50S ribosomal protein L2 [Candidatus Omnitrophota bacterium]
MGIKKCKPFTDGSRFHEKLTYEDITKTKPEKSLVMYIKKTGGRNFYGRITCRGKGGGHKRLYRIIDFNYSKKGTNGLVEAIEYDPNRSANIALVKYDDGEKKYLIAPQGIKPGSVIQSGPEVKIEIGNSTELRNIPLGTAVSCIELNPGRGAQIARSAGMEGIVAAKDAGNVHLRMPSGEIRLVKDNCYATIGKVGNLDHEKVSLGKAGRSRYLGIRPKSRAVAKNPVDHPMGGGEGKSSGGRHPTTPWGKITKGLKTRKQKKSSTFKIIKRRK